MQNYITPSSDISLIPLMWLCAGMQLLNGSHEQKHQWKKCVHTVDINTEKRGIKWGQECILENLSWVAASVIWYIRSWDGSCLQSAPVISLWFPWFSSVTLSSHDQTVGRHEGRGDCSFVSQAECFGVKTFVLGRRGVRWLSKRSEAEAEEAGVTLRSCQSVRTENLWSQVVKIFKLSYSLYLTEIPNSYNRIDLYYIHPWPNIPD